MKKLLIGLAALPLAGCISFGEKPPKALLTLSSTEQVPVGREQSSAGARTVTIQVPVVPQELATNRIPVQSNLTDVAYVRDAQWVELPARQFARVVSDTVAARTGRVVLSGAQAMGSPGARLSGELRTFGVDAGASAAGEPGAVEVMGDDHGVYGEGRP